MLKVKNTLITICISIGLLFTTLVNANEITTKHHYLTHAKTTADVLNDTWYIKTGYGAGLWAGTVKTGGAGDYWSNSAVTLISLLDLMEVSNNRFSFTDFINNTYIKARYFSYNYIGCYNNDSIWWGIAWLKAAQVLRNIDDSNPLITTYLTTATNIFNTISNTQWDTTNKGVWWVNQGCGSIQTKNTVTNGLFMIFAAELADEYPTNPIYLQRAKDTWKWFDDNQLVNSQQLVNDGLDANGVNDGGVIWTYNQGIVIGGLARLYELTYSKDYLKQAERIADASFHYLEDAKTGVIQNVCEWQDNCNSDNNVGQYNGIFMRYFTDLVEVTKDQDLQRKYKRIIKHTANHVWKDDRNKDNDQFGLKWTGTKDFSNPKSTDPMFQTSALDLFNSAARVEEIDCD